MPRETTIRRNIRLWLRAQGADVTTIHGGPFGRKGAGDLIVCWHGLFLWIECKTATGRAAPIQKRRLAAVRATGGVALIARSVEDVKEALGT